MTLDLFDNVPAPVKEAADWLLQHGPEKLPQARERFALTSQETADAMLLSMKVSATAEKENYDAFVEDTVVEYQPPTAIFHNKSGGLTIQQDQTGWMGADDVIIVLQSKEAVRSVINALQQKLEEM